MIDLGQVVNAWARAIEAADARRPVAVNQRSKQAFRPGIGPFAESTAIAMIMRELCTLDERYREFKLGVPYPELPRQKCDVCLGRTPSWDWAIEVKLLRFLGDNGQPNDNILMHILSPYAAHRSAITDCTKLVSSKLEARKAILIYGFDAEDWPLAPAIDSFEALAQARAHISARQEAKFTGLVHPIHRSGGVFAWEVAPRA